MQSFQLVVLNSLDSNDLSVEQDASHRLLLTLFADSVSQYGYGTKYFSYTTSF